MRGGGSGKGRRRTSGAEHEDEDEGEDVEGGVVVAMTPLGSAGGLLGRFLPALELGEEEGGWDIGPMGRCCRMHEP
jgi:hypothetical protein